MGWSLALVGTMLVWIPRLGSAEGAIWPTVLATIGFWVLGGLLNVLRRR